MNVCLYLCFNLLIMLIRKCVLGHNIFKFVASVCDSCNFFVTDNVDLLGRWCNKAKEQKKSFRSHTPVFQEQIW